jgi:acetyl esterase/lipase
MFYSGKAVGFTHCRPDVDRLSEGRSTTDFLIALLYLAKVFSRSENVTGIQNSPYVAGGVLQRPSPRPLESCDEVQSYLRGADARHPLASPLLSQFSGMPATRIHVGDDEVLLDDSLRYVERAAAAGVDVRADVWMGMSHRFRVYRRHSRPFRCNRTFTLANVFLCIASS